MESKQTLAQRAFDLLNSVPADKFIIGEFTNQDGACCSIGHYKRLTSENPNDYSWDNCDDHGNCDLRIASSEYILEGHGAPYDIADVNNDPAINGYKEPEIKDRVLHLLKDMIEAGY